MMSATAYADDRRPALARMPEQVLITPVPPSYDGAPFFTAAGRDSIREAGADQMDQ
jgi:hypothetical protein